MTMAQSAQRCRSGGLAAAGAAVSLALHGGVLAAGLAWMETKHGAIERATEAISVELLATEVLEVAAVSSAQEAAASLSSVQSDPGATEAAVASAVAQDTLDALAPTEEVAARDAIADGAPDGLPIVEGAIAAEQVRGETKTVKLRKTAALADDPHEIRRKLSEPRQKGGARSRTASASGASSGRVSASTGSAVDYAARVRARVAGHKPAGAGRSGTVIISFAISRSGGVSYASVARSSGDPTLDRSVLSAVRGAGPFPVPPPGADPRFSMPFYFR